MGYRVSGHPNWESEAPAEPFFCESTMSEIKLPLWNKDETDVLPQFHLTYGHVICDIELTEKNIRLLAKKFQHRKLLHAGPFNLTRIPKHESANCHTLGTDKLAHVIVVPVGKCHAIFAPHSWFMRNDGWIRWNKRVRGHIAIAHRLDLDEWYFNVFRDGKRLLSAAADGSNLRFLDDTPIEVRVEGRVIFQDEGSTAKPGDEIIALLQHDVRIQTDESGFRFEPAFSNHEIGPAMQYVFEKTGPGFWEQFLKFPS